MFEGIFSMRHVLSNEQIRTGMMHFRKIYCIFELELNVYNICHVLLSLRRSCRSSRRTKYEIYKILYESQIILYLQVFSIYTYVTRFTIFESLSVILFMLMSFGALNCVVSHQIILMTNYLFSKVAISMKQFFPRLLV